MVLFIEILPPGRQAPYSLHTIIADDLVTPWARASTCMVLSQFSQNILASAPEQSSLYGNWYSSQELQVVADHLSPVWWQDICNYQVDYVVVSIRLVYVYFVMLRRWHPEPSIPLNASKL